MAKSLRNACAIVGSGRAVTRKGVDPHQTPFQLSVRACVEAMKDAGIGRGQVGALFTGRAPNEYFTQQYNMSLVNELKIGPSFTSEITSHGAGGLGTLQYAVMALNAGVVDYALCVTGGTGGVSVDFVKTNASVEADLQFEAPYGVITPAIYAQSASRYYHEYGVTPAQAARVAVENRKWALYREDAAMACKGPITVDDVLSSPLIASPIRRLDCAVWYPGGLANAFVLTRKDIARAKHVPQAWMMGFGQCATHEWVGERMGGWGYAPFEKGASLVETGCSVAATQAYAMAGIAAKDADIAQTTAPFSFVNLLVLEQLGFCGRGEAGDFVDGGGVNPDGGLPFNTFGGYLSYGQVGQGLYTLQETIDQLSGRAVGRQVENAKIGVVHGHGGPLAAHSVVVVSSEELQ